MALSALRQEMGRNGLGGSEVAAAIGLHPYKSPVQLAAEKLGLVEPFAGNDATDLGIAMEPVIVGLYTKRERIPDFDITSTEPVPHPTAPHIFATPDRMRLVGPKKWIPVEIKTANARVAHRWGPTETDEVPEEYLIQVQVQMACTQASRADLVVLLGGSELRIYHLDADAELQHEVIDAAENFWTRYVARGELPPVDGSESASEYLKRRFPRDTRPLLPATTEALAIADRLREAKAARVQAETAETEAENELKAMIGDAAGIEGVATWKASKASKKTDWEAVVKVLNPDAALLAKFTTEKPGFRRFVLKSTPKE
ncbi:MAG: YqaJ viral recombinase family protein [Deltaproteobacteria bacterium]